MPCSITIKSQAQIAIYDFDPLTGSDVACVVRQGPEPQVCKRTSNPMFPTIGDGQAGADASMPSIDVFFVSFVQDGNCGCNSDAQRYFGDNSSGLVATLVCGNTTIDRQMTSFTCSLLG
jgi:hypothetical protein